MQFGLIISVLFHVAILGGALISIQSRAELRLPETEPVAVGMITPGEVTKVRQGVRTAKLLEAEPRESPKGDQAKKESAKPKLAAAAPPPPPPPPVAPEEKAEPAPKAVEPPPPAPAAAAEAQKKLEAEQRKQAEEQQRLAEEKQRAEAQEKGEAMQRAEEQKLAEEKKRAEAQEQAEAMKRAEEQKLAEERKRAEEEQKRLEEQRKQAELKKQRDEEKKRREAELKKKRAAEKKKREEEEKKRQEAEAAKAKQFDSDKIAALLNKVPDKAAPPPPSAADQPTKAKGPTLGAPDGKDKQLSASEVAMIQAAIRSCVGPHWRVLSGGASAQETVVRIRIQLNQDGTLSAPPVIVNPERTPYFVAISESALRAVQQCEPYSNLPPDKYQFWRDFIMKFSPKDMF